MKRLTKKLFIFAKNVDGGTGTFLIEFYNNRIKFDKYELVFLILQRPLYQSFFKNKQIEFFHDHQNSQNEKYLINVMSLINIFLEFVWINRMIQKY